MPALAWLRASPVTPRSRRFPDFSDLDPFKPHTRDHCNKWCKVHMIWDFNLRQNVSYPQQFNILTSTFGWLNVDVFIGPPAFFPKRPDYHGYEKRR